MAELNRLLQRLCEAEIEFVLVGGFAAMLHGSSMLTRDLDVCATLSPVNIEKLREAFRELHPTHRMTPQRMSFLDNPGPGIALNNLYLQTDFGALDLLGTITGVGNFERVRERSIEVTLFGRRVRVIAIDDLIHAKETLGRYKDIIVAKELRATREKLSNPEPDA